MTTPTAALKLCPFCSGAARIESNRDWHRLFADHTPECLFDQDEEIATVPATDECLAQMISYWNTRSYGIATRATEPALDTERERALFESWAVGPDAPWTASALAEFDGYGCYGDPEVQGHWEVWQARAALDKAGDGDLAKAKRALIRAGFVDHGGEEWKPPLGPLPKFIEVASADDARDAARWRAFRSRDEYENLAYDSFQDAFREEADRIVDQAIAALQRKDG